MDPQKNLAFNFLESQHFAVISTTGEDTPESALVGFGEREDFGLIVGTYTTTRKYENISKNPNVSLVIGFGPEKITIQYEGTAEIMPNEEKEEFKKLYE